MKKTLKPVGDWLAYLRALAVAKYRLRLARADIHAQMDYVKRLALELEQSKAAIHALAHILQARTKDLRAVHTDRRFRKDHITGQPLVR